MTREYIMAAAMALECGKVRLLYSMWMVYAVL
jgi:hypothetical protein